MKANWTSPCGAKVRRVVLIFNREDGPVLKSSAGTRGALSESNVLRYTLGAFNRL
jgi:hypothetical protein